MQTYALNPAMLQGKCREVRALLLASLDGVSAPAAHVAAAGLAAAHAHRSRQLPTAHHKVAACWRPYFGQPEWESCQADVAGRGHPNTQGASPPSGPEFFDDPVFPANATSLFNFDQLMTAESPCEVLVEPTTFGSDVVHSHPHC